MTPRRIAAAIFACALLCGGGAWYWRIFHSDERRIERVLRECAEAAEFRPGEPPAASFLKLRRLESRVCDELDASIRVQGREIRDRLPRKEVIARLAALRKYLSSLSIDLSDLRIAVAGDRASAELSVQLRGSGSERWRDPVLEEAEFTLRRIDGAWRVAAVRSRDFMER